MFIKFLDIFFIISSFSILESTPIQVIHHRALHTYYLHNIKLPLIKYDIVLNTAYVCLFAHRTPPDTNVTNIITKNLDN